MRKGSLANTSAMAGAGTGAGAEAKAGSASRRTASGRAMRTNTTRPTNYYPRPLPSHSAASKHGGGGAGAGEQKAAQQGEQTAFFPALQYFSDAVTALPREVVRHFTLMKEVEAKIHGPNKRLGEMLDGLIQEAVPARKWGQQDSLTARQQGQGGGLVSLTTNNSAMHSAQNSVAGSVVGEDDGDSEMVRRRQYHDLRMLTHSLLPNLEEKNVVLEEANRVLALQLLRVDSVLPHLANEISEEARLGSMTHWAYSENRIKKTAPTVAPGKRDIAAANSLAAAASVVHETEMAQARREAGRAATTKVGKGKAAAAAAALAAPTALPISTSGEAVKRRKVDKGLAAPVMERTASKGSKATYDTPRCTPAAEAPSNKGSKATAKSKAAPPPPTIPKKRITNSAQSSPALATGPLYSTTNLRHDRLAEQDSRPTSSAAAKGNGNGEIGGNGKRKQPLHKQEQERADAAAQAQEAASKGMMQEDVGMQDFTAPERPVPSRSNSSKTGKASKAATPRDDKFLDAPSVLRSRTTRSRPGNTRNRSMSDDSAEQGTSSKHKRHVSKLHLVKQLAPFNRSPDLDRHRDIDKDDDMEDEELEANVAEEKLDGTGGGRGRSSRPVSRRGPQTAVPVTSPSPAPPPERIEPDELKVEEAEDVDLHALEEADSPPLPGAEDLPALSPDRDITPPTVGAEPADFDEADDDAVEEQGDPDDPNEPKYCYCNQGSYGEMVACDNDGCAREWFHIGCTELKESPGEEEVWYCEECRPLFAKRRGGGGKGGGSRGRKR